VLGIVGVESVRQLLGGLISVVMLALTSEQAEDLVLVDVLEDVSLWW
jgi:hypothetical protein